MTLSEVTAESSSSSSDFARLTLPESPVNDDDDDDNNVVFIVSNFHLSSLVEIV